MRRARHTSTYACTHARAHAITRTRALGLVAGGWVGEWEWVGGNGWVGMGGDGWGMGEWEVG